MNLQRFYKVKFARSISEYAQDADTNLWNRGKGRLGQVKDWIFGSKGPSLGERYRGRRNTGLALALGYGNDMPDAKLRQLAAIGTIGAGAAAGGVGGFYGSRALADQFGLDADSSLAKRIGRYALMTGGTLGGATLGGSLASAGSGYYVPTDAATRDISRRVANAAHKANMKAIAKDKKLGVIGRGIERFKANIGNALGEGSSNIRRGDAAANREYNYNSATRSAVPIQAASRVVAERKGYSPEVVDDMTNGSSSGWFPKLRSLANFLSIARRSPKSDNESLRKSYEKGVTGGSSLNRKGLLKNKFV